MYSIYALCDPLIEANVINKNCLKPSWVCYDWWKFSLAHRVRYIGLTDDIYRRFYEHMSGRYEANRKKNNWIAVRKSQQTMIHLEVLQQVESLKVAQIRETFWIAYYHYLQADLLNIQKYAWLPGKDMLHFLENATSEGYYDRFDLNTRKMWQIWSRVRRDEDAFVSRDRTREKEEQWYGRGKKSPFLERAISIRESQLSWKVLYDRPAEEVACEEIEQKRMFCSIDLS